MNLISIENSRDRVKYYKRYSSRAKSKHTERDRTLNGFEELEEEVRWEVTTIAIFERKRGYLYEEHDGKGNKAQR